MRTSSKYLVAAVAVCALASGLNSRAAEPENRTDREKSTTAVDSSRDKDASRDREGHEGSSANMDKHLADKLIGMSQGEIQLGNFALKHTQNPEVKKFAQMMVQAHTEFNNKLARYASEGVWNENRSGASSDNRAHQPETTTNAADNKNSDNKTADNKSTETKSTENGGDQHGDKMVQIGKDMGDQINTAIERELGQYQGNEFDRAYVGQQFWGHVVFIATAKAMDNHIGSNELKQVVQEGEKAANHHLDETRKLIREISSNVARAGSNTETQPRR